MSKERKAIANELHRIVNDAKDAIENTLKENGYVYAEKYIFRIGGKPFFGHVPVVDDDMVSQVVAHICSNRFFASMLHTVGECKAEIAEYEAEHSPEKEIERLQTQIDELRKKVSRK